MIVMVVSRNASVIFLTLILSYACEFAVISMEVWNEKTTTPNVSVENNHKFSHKNNKSSFLKHRIASNTMPTNKEISSAPNIVEFMEENRNDSIIYRSIQMDKTINKPDLEKKSVFSGICDAQYLCGTNTLTSIKSYTICRNGTEICTRIPYILKRFGSYTCGYCNQPQQSQQVARILGDSFFPGITIKTTKKLHYQGEYVNIFWSVIDLTMLPKCRQWLGIFSSNTEDYRDFTVPYEQIDLCCIESWKASMFINWKPGEYKAVLFTEFGPTLAVSNSFRVMKQTGKLMSSSKSYSLGETMHVIAFGFNLPLRADDFIRIIPANVSQIFHIAPYATYSEIREFSGARNIVVPFYANWTLGRYKAVLFLKESTVVLAVSNVFEIKNPIVEVSTSKRTYYEGEEIVVMLDSTRGNLLREYDQVGIVLSNITKKFESARFITKTNLYEAYGGLLGSVSFYVNMSFAVGKYRAVFLSEDSYAKAMSQVFQVKKNRIQLITTKTSYSRRDDIILSFKSLSGVPFRSGDWLKIIAADITSDYFDAPFARVLTESIGDGLTFGNISIFENLQVGKYKAVLFIDDYNFASAVSNEFNVVLVKANKIQLNSTKTIYYHGTAMQLIIQSLDGVRFYYYDFLKIIPANITSDYYDAWFVYWGVTYDVGGLTSGNISIYVNMDVGEYKAVFFMNDATVASAVSNDFHILPNIIQLNSSKTTYKRSEPVVFRFSSISGVPFRYLDWIRIISVSITGDYEDVIWDYIRIASGLTSGNLSISINWSVGNYRAEFYIQGISRYSAVSNEFNIL